MGDKPDGPRLVAEGSKVFLDSIKENLQGTSDCHT